MGSTFGHMFRITTWGESHGQAVGVVIDGCPPRIDIELGYIQAELNRRKPGQSALSTQRQEADRAEILSGVFEGKSLGTPILIVVWNRDGRAKDYRHTQSVYRPSHADYTYDAKYGFRNWKGGGRASARETIGRVAAGAIAKSILSSQFNIDIMGWVSRVGQVECSMDPEQVQRDVVEANPIRCPDLEVAAVMEKRILQAKQAGDSLGGLVSCVARGVPAGWGDPVFDKLEADLGKGILSVPACKGVEFGAGFGGTKWKGSQHNDLFCTTEEGSIGTTTNHSGGIQGGISNGQSVVVRAAFKPTATIMRAQETIDSNGQPTVLEGRGRHDPCVLPRAVPIVEAMMALTLVDHALRHRGQCG